MKNGLVYIDKDKFKVWDDHSEKICSSEYLKKYKKNSLDIQKKVEWKTQGFNAAFRQEFRPSTGLENLEGKINGLSCIEEENKILYSVSIDDFSGVFVKSLDQQDEFETHIVHDNKAGFYNLDYNQQTGEVVIAIRQSTFDINIGLLDIKTSRYRMLTEGETMDGNPVWGKKNPQMIYYDSAGIGRDRSGSIGGLGPRVINSLNLDSYDLVELVSDPKYNFFSPKVDKDDNLYFIKMPYRNSEKKPVSILDILFIPFKILKAIYKAIELFTMKHTGEQFTSKGSNPAKAKSLDMKEVIIQGNLINAEKNYQENQISGQPFPGIAPKNWELIRMDSDGTHHTVKQGVIGFTLDRDGNPICSNGKYILRITADGKEEIIHQTDFVEKLLIYQ